MKHLLILCLVALAPFSDRHGADEKNDNSSCK